MKLILASSLILFGASQAKLDLTSSNGKPIRWRFADKCVTMKSVTKRTFNSLHLQSCIENNNANGIQQFTLKDEKITTVDGSRCLYFNNKTNLFAMVKMTSDKYCKTADDKANRFVHIGAGKIRLKGDSKNCVSPQTVIHKKFSKLVNGPECANITEIKEYADRTVMTNVGQMTYTNAIFNAISRSGAQGNTMANVMSSVKAVFGAKFDEAIFKRTFKRMSKANTITLGANGRFTNTKEACKGKGPNGKCDHKTKGKNNYPKMIFAALQTSPSDYKSVDKIVEIMKTTYKIDINSSKVSNILMKHLRNGSKVIQKNSNKEIRLVDPSCKKGLHGLCDNSKKN